MIINLVSKIQTFKKKKKTEKGNVDKIVREGVQKTLNPLSCSKTCG